MMSKKLSSWYCANKNCTNILGHVSNNELILNLEDGAVLNSNTNGNSLVVVCAKCGNPKVWYPSLESSVIGAINAIKREVITSNKN